MTDTIEITFGSSETPITVKGVFIEGEPQTLLQPGCLPCVEDTTIIIGGHDVTELIAEEILVDIEIQAVEEYFA